MKKQTINQEGASGVSSAPKGLASNFPEKAKTIEMKNTKNIFKILIALLFVAQNSFAQVRNVDTSTKGKNTETDNSIKKIETNETPETAVNTKSNINNINGGMPNRISMTPAVGKQTQGKQTQGATFGEKVNAGKTNVVPVKGGCNESVAFGEKVNAGLHAAGNSVSQGASLLGGAMPGGAVISAAVSSVGNSAGGAGGGAAAASYAATGKQVLKKDNLDPCSAMPKRKNTETESSAANNGRHTPFHNKSPDGTMVIAIPEGGGTSSGVLTSNSVETVDSRATERSINESGVSVKSEPRKSSIKK